MLASRIGRILDSIGLPTFVYGDYSVAGQNRFSVIRDRISECPYFVLLLTRRARSSQWVNQEIGFATAKEKEIIPLVETSDVRERRIQHFGFTELHDPIDLNIDHPEKAIGLVLNTLMSYAKRDRHWTGMITLTCRCGSRNRKGLHDLTQWRWNCTRCMSVIEVSPVTFEQSP